MPRKKNPKFFADGELPKEAVQLEAENQNIDEIMGNAGVKSGAFSTFNQEEYKRRLDEMTLIDIQKECISHSIWPSKTKDALIDQLIQAHARYISQYESSKIKPKRTPKLTKEAADFLEKTAKNKVN